MSRKGTSIISDFWKAYNCLEDEGFLHEKVNYSLTYVCPETGVHTKIIEALWSTIKRDLQKTPHKAGEFDSYWYEDKDYFLEIHTKLPCLESYEKNKRKSTDGHCKNDGQEAEVAALKQKLVHMETELKMVIAELEQVKEERAHDKINFETEKCELESKIDKCKKQCTELQSEKEKLQSENEKRQSENEKLQSENEKLQRENEKFQKYLQDLESANINVEEKNQITLAHNTDLNSQITKVIAELEQVKEERAHDKINFETEKCELESKIDKCKKQCTELQSEKEEGHIEEDIGKKIMNNRYPQTPGMVPPLGIPRDYPYGHTPMLTSNPLFPSGAGFVPNMSASPYPSTAFTSGKCSNSSLSSSSYLLAPNNPYPVSTSPYPVSSSSFYPTNSNRPHPAPTSAYPCNSNRHYPSTNSSYSGPSSMNQSPSASPYPLLGSRGYDCKFGPSVNETNDYALNINSLPNEIILKVFNYLTQNQLGQIARVCRRWNVLTKSPVLWRKVNVKIFAYVWGKHAKEQRDIVKSFINGLPSCVTFIRLDFQGFAFFKMDFEELCVKLHQNCPYVEELILTNLTISNLLSEVINFCCQFLQCVKKLEFLYCHFSKSSRTVELNDNSKIEVLDLYHCDISRVCKTQFSKLLYLKELRLAVANVDDTWFVDDASFFNRLHVLNLGWTYITASTFLAIQRYGHNLKELYLCGFHLQDLDLSFTDSVYPRLKTICLSIYRVTCEVVISFIQSCTSLENVYVYEDVVKSFGEHPFVVANRCKSGIVKAINWDHNHDVDYSLN